MEQHLLGQWMVESLETWFVVHRRSLPWRENPTPYHVWVSEIMLQQTRVEAVKGYYDRFLCALPDVETLSQAPEEQLLKLWEGLGYYNRVRNMQIAARTIMQEYDGEFPDTFEEIRKLKGIGDYTAGAIASIAFHEAVSAVDGNVLRVVSRLLGSSKDISLASTKKEVTQWLNQIVPFAHPELFNQSLMELGALVCLPNGKPRCEHCPLAQECIAYQNGLTDQIPVKAKKKARRVEKKTVLLLLCEDKIAITKRASKGLLAGLWQFPMMDARWSAKKCQETLEEVCDTAVVVEKSIDGTHIFSHIEWQMKGYEVTMKKNPGSSLPDEVWGQTLCWVDFEQLQTQYSIPSAFERYKEYIKDKRSK